MPIGYDLTVQYNGTDIDERHSDSQMSAALRWHFSFSG